MMEKVQKPSNPKYNTPSSETFRTEKIYHFSQDLAVANLHERFKGKYVDNNICLRH
jgi:hypothetical protein